MNENKPDIWDMMDLCTPWCIHVAATLQIADHLSRGISNITALATVAHSHEESLHRVLRQLTRKGIFIEPTPGNFAMNDAARQLLDPGVKLGLDLNGIGGRMAHSWSTLLTAVQTGQPAYNTLFGRPFWNDLATHPEINASFDELMSVAGHGTPDANFEIEGGWNSIRTVVDVGGGTGALLAEILRAHPHIKGTLVDLPNSIARSAPVFSAAGVSDRAGTSAQSFFDPLPPGKDLYVMQKVLADWPDHEATLLLKRCAEAARPTGRLVLLGEIDAGTEGGQDPELLMLVLVGGKGRTLSQFHDLANASGLEVVATRAAKRKRITVECRPI